MRVPCKICYGVDYSEGLAVVVKSTRHGKTLKHETVFAGYPGEGIPVSQDIRKDVEENRAAISASMPVRDSTTRWLETPFASVQKAQKVLPSILDVQLPFPLEECVFGFPCVQSPSGRNVRALSVTSRISDVEKRVDQLKTAGLDPVILDHEGLSLWTQGLADIPAETGIMRIIAYAGFDRTVLVIGRGDEYIGSYSSRNSLRSGRDASGGETSAMKDDSEIISRIRRVLRTHVSESGSDRIDWIWSGPCAGNKAVINRLQERMETLAAINFRSARDPDTFLARALSSRTLADGPVRWNFRTGDIAHSRLRDWERTRHTRIAATYLVAGVLLCVMNLGWQYMLHYRDEQAQSMLMERARALAHPAPVPPGQERLIAERAVGEHAELYSPFRNAMDAPLTGMLNQVLHLALAGGLSMESLSLREDYLLIQGSTDDWNRIDQVAERLREEGWQISVDRQDALADERVRFRITAGDRQ